MHCSEAVGTVETRACGLPGSRHFGQKARRHVVAVYVRIGREVGHPHRRISNTQQLLNVLSSSATSVIRVERQDHLTPSKERRPARLEGKRTGNSNCRETLARQGEAVQRAFGDPYRIVEQ